MQRFNFKDWNDLTSETWREYVSESGSVYRIDNPKKFFISQSGTHYVLDNVGVVHTLRVGDFMVLRFNDTNTVSFVAPSVKAA